MFRSFAYSWESGRVFFYRHIENKGNILYLEPKHTFKEIKMARNKHQEDSTNGREGDNDLEAMMSSFGLQEVFLSADRQR